MRQGLVRGSDFDAAGAGRTRRLEGALGPVEDLGGFEGVRRVGSDAGGQADEGVALADEGGAQTLGGPDAAGLGRVLEDDAEARGAEAADGVRLAERVAEDVGEGDGDVVAAL